MYRHPVKPKLLEDSTTFAGILRTAPNTPKKMAQAIDVKSKTITESSMPKGPSANRKPITIGKYPRIGMDCSKSMKGVRTSDANLFVEANMPKETPQITEAIRVIRILAMVLKVYKGRFLISSYGRKVMISQVMTQIMTNPTMKLTRALLTLHSPA
jgi:hypothetical protein